VAADYAGEFRHLFEGRFGTGKSSGTPFPRVRVGSAQIVVYFAPEERVAMHVLQRLNVARRSIHFITFSYTSSAIADAMVAQTQAGLAVVWAKGRAMTPEQAIAYALGEKIEVLCCRWRARQLIQYRS